MSGRKRKRNENTNDINKKHNSDVTHAVPDQPMHDVNPNIVIENITGDNCQNNNLSGCNPNTSLNPDGTLSDTTMDASVGMDTVSGITFANIDADDDDKSGGVNNINDDTTYGDTTPVTNSNDDDINSSINDDTNDDSCVISYCNVDNVATNVCMNDTVLHITLGRVLKNMVS